MLQKLYLNRFSERDRKNNLWKVLVEKYLQQFVTSEDSVLDIACGYGEFINNIVCSKTYALDINPDVKKSLNKNVNFIKGYSSKIPLKNQSIDKIFISNFFEHITRDEITKTVKELKRILKPDGKVLVIQPNIRFCAKDYWMFFDHITPIDDRALSEIFEVFDFKVLKKIEKFLPYTTKTKLPQSPLLLLIYLKIPLLWKIFGAQSFLIFRLRSQHIKDQT